MPSNIISYSIERTKHVVGSVAKRVMPRWIIIRVYRYLASRYIAELDFKRDYAKKTILFLNHFFDQDGRALMLANTDYNFINIHTPTLFKGAKIFFREDIKGLNAPYCEENSNMLNEYYFECRLIYDSLQAKFGANLIVTPSDNYYWVREFIKCAREKGVKTVVLDKEGMISPHHFEAEAERTRNFAPFMSDHIFVWSERQRCYWNKIGASIENISIIGQPRSDLFYREMDFVVDSYFVHKRPLVTFFTYEDDAYIPLELVNNEGLSWKKMKLETQDFLYEMAKKYPEYNFIFKAHPQQTDLDLLQQKYERINLRVIGGAAVANELIVRSELIIAFQTTAVVEAMFMNKRVIYTAWDTTTERLEDHILPFHKAPGIVKTYSANKFQDVCNRFFEGNMEDFMFSQEEEEQKRVMISEYLYKPDGHVSERFFVELGKFIK